MHILGWIILFGLFMSVISLSGGLLLFLKPSVVDVVILPLVAFAAGSLIGGSLYHMIPHAVEKMGNVTELYIWITAGFVLFLGLEQFLNWHHSHTHSHSHSYNNALNAPTHQHQHPAQCPSSCLNVDGHGHGHGHVPPKAAASASLRRIDETTDLASEEANDTRSNNTVHSNNSNGGGGGDDEDRDIEKAQTVTNNGTAVVGEESMQVHRDENQQDHSQAKPQKHSSLASQNLSTLILIADGLHNFLGGLFVGASFVDDLSLGISAWMAAAFHEIPQELGDYAILVHGGWSPSKALLFNFLSSLTFLLGAIIAYFSSTSGDVSFLIPFAAGNFLYIGASDLIPEIKHHHGAKQNALLYASFLVGLGVLLATRIIFDGY